MNALNTAMMVVGYWFTAGMIVSGILLLVRNSAQCRRRAQ